MTHRSRNLTDAQIERLRRIWMSGKYARLSDLARGEGVNHRNIYSLAQKYGWPYKLAEPIKQPTNYKPVLDKNKALAAWERLCAKTNLKLDTLKYFRQQDMAWQSVGRRHKKAADE